MGAGLVVGVWVARYLGPERFGQFNHTLAFVALFSTIASMGIDGVLVRDLVREPHRRDELVASALVLRLGSGFVAFLASCISIVVLHPSDRLTQLLVLIGSGTLILHAFDVFDLWFQARTESRFVVYARNVAFAIHVALRVVLILARAPVEAFLIAVVTEAFLVACGQAFAFWRLNRPHAPYAVRLSAMLHLLAEAWPLLLSSLAVMVYMRIDQVMLAELVGEHEVGVYSAALRLSEIWYMVPIVIVNSSMALLTQSRGASLEAYSDQLRRMFRVLARLAYSVALVMTVLSPLITRLLYGDAYAGSGPILAVHVWTALFVFVGVGLNPWILNEGLQRLQLFQTATGAICNILLNLVLIPRLGGLGAAAATLMSQLLASYLTLLCSGRTRPMFKVITAALLLR
jgi:PST family polysaccharide transporter